MTVEVTPHRARPVRAADVVSLYAEAGWWPERTAGAVETVLAEGPAVGAWDAGRLVGFARAVSDGRFRAYLEDIVVAGDHRRLGIASRLVNTLLDELDGVDTISVFCDAELAPLYEASRFHRTKQVILHRRVQG